MRRLPAVKPRVVVRALERIGFSVVRTRGSHYQLRNPENGRRVTVPYHDRDLSRGTLAAILQQAGLSVEEFSQLVQANT
jgi:predicted RNA binding protein YcfA (HicA-like mRNA interferase family)